MTNKLGLPQALGLAAHLGRGVQRVATDAVVRGLRPFPRSAVDRDARTLSRLMGRTVTSVSVLGGDAGTSSRVRLALTGRDVPNTVFVKLPDWVYSPSADHSSMLTGTLLKTSARRIAENSDIPVRAGRFIDENYRAVAQLLDEPPHTIMPGDAHPGNVYFRNGAAGVLDWQAVRRGHLCRTRTSRSRGCAAEWPRWATSTPSQR